MTIGPGRAQGKRARGRQHMVIVSPANTIAAITVAPIKRFRAISKVLESIAEILVVFPGRRRLASSAAMRIASVTNFYIARG